MPKYVYCIKNEVNGKIYVGKHSKSNLGSYFRGKINRALSGKRDCVLLARAVRKYGANNFSIVPLISLPDGFSSDQLNDLERYFIRCLRSRESDIGYNLASGGEGGSGTFDQDRKLAASLRFKGRKIGPAWRARLSASLKGRKFTTEHRLKIASSRKGKPRTQQLKENLSIAKKKQWGDQEFREVGLKKLRESTSTDEARRNNSKAQKQLTSSYTAEYRSWVAKRMCSSRWGMPFNEPMPSKYLSEVSSNA